VKAIVFGGSGFVGSHVADALTAAGHGVTIFDQRPSPWLVAGQQFVQGDILDPEAVAGAMASQSAVYNFAGLASLEECHVRPVDTARINVLGNAILLDAARSAGATRYVFASTVYVYGEAGSFYRCSKQACELYIEEFQRCYGLDFTILRYGSLYGRRANDLNGVHSFLKQALLKRRIVFYGTGDERRDYIHVEDAARASVEVLAPEFANQYVMLTGHQSMQLRDFLEMIREIVGNDVQIEFCPEEDPPAPGQFAHYSITPYAFRPRVGKKLVSPYYLDLGQGLLDCLHEIQAQSDGDSPHD
jgi:UDP-glucose 4-epimerase